MNRQDKIPAADKIPTAAYAAENKYMQMAVDEARKGIYRGDGGPFGSVVVKDGKVVGRGHNRVISGKDSTCHGEIDAIRKAEKKLGTHDLSDCDIYTTGEPCPMCLAACLWANIRHVYYGCTIADNASIGFRDVIFDKLLGGRRKLTNYQDELDREACLKLFEEYGTLQREIY